jgi:cytochrome bd-type quinol oxidase subunit 1
MNKKATSLFFGLIPFALIIFIGMVTLSILARAGNDYPNETGPQTQVIQEMLNSEVSIGALSYFTWTQIILIVGIFGGILAVSMFMISKYNKEAKQNERDKSNNMA